MAMMLELPWPPSVNKYWRHPSSGPLAGRHLVSEVGRKYRDKVRALTIGKYERIDKRCAVRIEAYPPDKRRRDLDNMLKAVLDALVYAKVLADDSLIDELCIFRREQSVIGEVLVKIEQLEA
jgi:crossover junction endodeoxyribonuclease RusA